MTRQLLFTAILSFCLSLSACAWGGPATAIGMAAGFRQSTVRNAAAQASHEPAETSRAIVVTAPAFESYAPLKITAEGQS